AREAARPFYLAYVLMTAKVVNYLGYQFAGGLDKPCFQIFIRLMSLIIPTFTPLRLSRTGLTWMTDGWPLYESRLKGKLHVISKRYTQRIERHNLNLRQHLARLGRKSLSFSKSVELHDKVIGHYLNIKHYQ
ncbi:IS1 family transposase, partial [Escherichia coli]|uniref:IS1 family transposase n=1 Tax=Escherichia coli TaxID=562 RepID=UPI003D1E93A3